MTKIKKTTVPYDDTTHTYMASPDLLQRAAAGRTRKPLNTGGNEENGHFGINENAIGMKDPFLNYATSVPNVLNHGPMEVAFNYTIRGWRNRRVISG